MNRETETLTCASNNNNSKLNSVIQYVFFPRHRRRITEISDLIRDQPMSPQESVIYWTEYVIRHGAKHLQSPVVNMPLYQYLLLDVIGLILFVIFITFFLAYYFLRCVYNYIRREKNYPLKMKKQ